MSAPDYTYLFMQLKPDKLYTSSTIADTAVESGLLHLYRDEANVSQACRRFCKDISEYAQIYLPDEPDRMMRLSDGREAPGWFGCRWMLSLSTLSVEQEQELQDLLIDLIADSISVSGRAEYGRIFEPVEAPPAFTPPPAGSSSQTRENRVVHFLTMLLVRFALMGRTKKIVLGLVLAGVFSFGAMVTFSHREGFRILREKGPRAALNWFMHADQLEPGNPDIKFGLAWSHFDKGDLERAETLCHELLDGEIPEKTRGKVFYLLGHIQGKTGRYEASRASFYNALDVYERIGDEINQVITSLGLARSSMENRDFATADDILSQDLPMVKDSHRGYFFFLRARLAFLREDYEEALTMTRFSHEKYELVGEPNKIADSLVEWSLYSILTGDPDTGFEKALEAQEMIQETGDSDKFYFNLVNFMLIRKCRGEDPQIIGRMIGDWATRNKDSHLYDLLAFAEKYPCGLQKRGEGDPPTPHDDEDYPNPP